MTFTLQALHPGTADHAAFVDALEGAKLPTDDLRDGGRFFAIRDAEELVGFGGLDGSGQDQLIRSLVTLPGARGRGYGRAAVGLLSERAAAEEALRLWLLTTSADRFFGALGWQTAERADAPHAIRTSRQFAGLCPSSAVLMCRHLA